MLRDLTIQGYRCFKDFHIDGLARVNLLVGPNNAGKTSFLEAVYLLSCYGYANYLLEILYYRGEISEHPPSSYATSHTNYYVSHIFYGHKLQPGQRLDVFSDKEQPLHLTIQFKKAEPERGASHNQLAFTFLDHEMDWQSVNKEGAILEESVNYPVFPDVTKEHPPNCFVSVNGLSINYLAELWDRITLTPKEEDMVSALQVIQSDVQRISFTSRRDTNNDILLKLKNQRAPVPLSSMGDGMRRILTLVASAVVSENGVLLVDEIDTGLYYETQIDMWRLLIETAQRLNVQIFATTHSWDCVRAFQEALAKTQDSSVGKLFRLEKSGDDIKSVEYTASDLEVAVRELVEVR